MRFLTKRRDKKLCDVILNGISFVFENKVPLRGVLLSSRGVILTTREYLGCANLNKHTTFNVTKNYAFEILNILI